MAIVFGIATSKSERSSSVANLMKGTFLALLAVGLLCVGCEERVQPKVLVFSKTQAYRHESIAAGKKMMLALGQSEGFQIDTTENAEFFHDTTLIKYSAVVFMNTTGDVLDSAQQEAMTSFIKSGKGFLGIHAASDTEYQWPWYGQLVGAYFKSHPAVQRALFVKSPDAKWTDGLPDRWYHSEEIYNFQQVPSGVQVIFTVDENSYQGGEHPEGHPVAWWREFDGGRSFYTAMGHRAESYSDPLFQRHILNGLVFALGKQ